MGVERPEMAEGLERLVGEVERVPAVDVDVIGDGGEHRRFDLVRRAGGDRRRQRALGAIGVAGVDEPPVPTEDALDRLVGSAERSVGEPWGLAADVAGEEGERMDEGERPVARREPGQQVRHAGQHGHPAPPPVATVAFPEPVGDLEDRPFSAGQFEQRRHGLGDHQREAVFEPVLQPPAPPLGGSRARAGTNGDGIVVGVDQHLEPGGVVGPRVERATAGEVEPGVVPMAGDEAGLDRPLVQRETEVRAPILDRERCVLVPDHQHRQVAGLAEQPSGPPEFGERSDRVGDAERVRSFDQRHRTDPQIETNDLRNFYAERLHSSSAVFRNSLG